ncbi:hypothetical protein GIB67_011725 [Kingdonia uniflora]|uniref:Uncharacterized protein n=1 Tax=Kingdonia uniflora TaxID=39325 RepID=A0A7J7LUC3_9MAGN|nr:hypothetical protein GIB67_011725 [Kingdonia uniflora]
MQEARVLPDKATCNILVQMCSRERAIGALHHILWYMKKNFIILRQSFHTEAREALKIYGESDYVLKEANPHLSLEGREDISESCKTMTIDVSSRTVLHLLEMRNFIAVEKKMVDMEVKDPKVYTRDTIWNISKILRYST